MKLTDEEIKNVWYVCGLGNAYDIPPSEDEYIFARAIEAALSAKQGEQEAVCPLCHGKGEHEMFSAHLPGQPVPERRMVKCNQCANPAPSVNAQERISELEVEKDAWQGRYYAADGQREKYMELMDAHAKELDRAMDLLRHAETEMRYAGWGKRLSDNPGRADVYEAIKEFLK